MPSWLKRLLAAKPLQAVENPRETTELPDETLPEYFVVTDVMDLHGFFPEQVPDMLESFLENAHVLGLAELRIVHGKGKSKLKWVVRDWLGERKDVEWFGDAPPERGGWGATVVILTSGQKQDRDDPG